MILIISLVLAFVPLVGIAYIAVYGAPFTVDGLFMSLILLAMSGVLALNALLELRQGRTAAGTGANPTARGASAFARGGMVQRGKVLSVQFFESHVGQPNKSVVTLSNGSNSAHLLVLDGDVRNALPVGRSVEITLRKNEGDNVLVNVDYA